MSPSSFGWFVTSWLALSLPLLLLACYLALVPWLPRGEPPGYALALLGGKPSELVPRCSVQVQDASGRMTEVITDGACGTASPAPGAAKVKPATGPSITMRRMAAAVHGVLTLGGALLACWGLLHLLRRPFLQHSPPSWVRRTAA